MSKLSTQPYKGTRDFYPQDMRVRSWIFSKIRRCLTARGYEEYDGPMLEPFELYASKTSEEIVNEQLYWLIDRGERKLAIRPEMTPTLARMVAAKQNELPKPLRWFSIPNLWRYERPQRGRLREHWQLNVDVFGGGPLTEDVEVCSTIAGLMAEFGAPATGQHYEVRLNHRALTDAIFRDVAHIPAELCDKVAHLLDAAPKAGVEAFTKGLKDLGLDDKQVGTMVNLLSPEAITILEPHLQANPHYAHLLFLMRSLKELGIVAAFRFDPSIMRGFMYYTGLVLEVFDKHPDNNRALFGGGRYDNLVGMFGGQPLAGVGFGMGDVTFRNFLESHGLLPEFKTRHGVYVCALDESLLMRAQLLAEQIRSGLKDVHTTGELPVLAGLGAEKPKKAFVTAERLGCRFIVFVGADDVAKGAYPMKDTLKQAQFEGDTSALADYVVKAL